MRLKVEQLDQHLNRHLAPLYVVFGDEPLLSLEAQDQVRRVARERGYTEREVMTVEQGFDWASLAGSSGSLSLFGNRRLLELRIPGGKPGSSGATALVDFCTRLPEETVTLVVLPKLDKAALTSRWFKALDDSGVVVPVYPVDRHALPQWISRRLARQGQSAGDDAIGLLAERVEGNLLAAWQEIQKLGLLYPVGPLSLDQVQQAVSFAARFDAFAWVDAVVAGDTPRSARILSALAADGTDPTLLLWALSREIRLLMALHQGISAGRPWAQLARDMRLWDRREALARGALKRLSASRLEAALGAAAAVDRSIKGMDPLSPWLALARLGQSLA